MLSRPPPPAPVFHANTGSAECSSDELRVRDTKPPVLTTADLSAKLAQAVRRERVLGQHRVALCNEGMNVSDW